jgi:hypothetical protein
VRFRLQVRRRSWHRFVDVAEVARTSAVKNETIGQMARRGQCDGSSGGLV